MENKKTIGILGGMGPEATSDLFRNIVLFTDAKEDPDHIQIFINNNPQIPDRTAYILKKGPSPVPALIESARQLESWGVDFIIIPCNTAHYFYDEIISVVSIPVLNMIDEAARWAKVNLPAINRFGLLSTLGTYHTGLYEKYFEKQGLKIIVPEKDCQYMTMEAVYGEKGLKAGYRKIPFTLLEKVVNHLLIKGVDAIIGGCTEISLIVAELKLKIPVLNPVIVLAKRSIEFAGGKAK